MKIAICDDEEFARESIVTCVENYSIERKNDIDYEVFDSYVALESRIPEFDVFIMDYQTPEIDGMTFAKKIREDYGEKKAIIFVTSYQEIVFDAFSVRALRFLVKPLSEEKLFEALDAYMKTDIATNHFVIKNEGTTSVIDTDEIYYIEVSGRDITVCLEGAELSCRRTISSVEDELKPFGFYKAHRSYLVNMRKIKSFNRNTIEFTNGKRIDMSPRNYKDFCREYLKYE